MPPGKRRPQTRGRQKPKYEDPDPDDYPEYTSGNLTADPELRFTPSGRAVSRLRIACSDRKLNEDTGEWEDQDTTYLNITAWGALAENVCESLYKGDRIVVHGRVETREYTDKDDNERTDVQLVARDIGPSLLFRTAKIDRPQRKKAPVTRSKPKAENHYDDDNPPF